MVLKVSYSLSYIVYNLLHYSRTLCVPSFAAVGAYLHISDHLVLFCSVPNRLQSALHIL